MTLEAWPDELPCGVIRYGFTGGLRSAGAPFNQPPGQGATIGGPHWVASQSDGPLRGAAQLLALRALQGRLDGGAAGVLLPACPGQMSPQIKGGAPIVAAIDGAAVSGATALMLDISAGDFHDLVGGERFNLTHADDTVGVRLYQVDEVTGGTRAAPQIRITPPLRGPIADGSAVTFDNLVAPMRCVGGLANLFDQNRFGDTEASWEEWFEQLAALNLRDLALSPHVVNSGAVEDTFVGFILNTTAGSTLTLTNDAGGRFKLVDNGGGVWSITTGATATDYAVAHAHNITVTETLAGYANSPKANILTVDVVQVLARYVRLRAIHTHNADASFKVAQVGFLDDWAGAELAGVAISSARQDAVPASAAFDGNSATSVWLLNGGWIGLDLGAPTARPTEVYLQSSASDATAYPSSFAFEEGFDDGLGGIDWRLVKTFTAIPAVQIIERLYFAVADPALSGWAAAKLWRRHRVRAITVQGGSNFGPAELHLHAHAGDLANIGGAVRGSGIISGFTPYLTDGLGYTALITTMASGGWFDWDNGLNPRAQIEELAMTSNYWNQTECALSFVVEASNWGGQYTQIGSFTTPAWPPGFPPLRTFSIP